MKVRASLQCLWLLHVQGRLPDLPRGRTDLAAACVPIVSGLGERSLSGLRWLCILDIGAALKNAFYLNRLSKDRYKALGHTPSPINHLNICVNSTPCS